MSTIKAVLLKPLDGFAEDSEREFDKADFERLKAMGAVRAASDKPEKAAPAVENKMAPEALNKEELAAVTSRRSRRAE